MKKLLATTIAATLLAASATSAQASTVAQAFNVTVDLTAQCTITTVGTPTLDFGVYTAFVGPATAAPVATATMDCTRGLAAPTFSYDGGTSYGVLAGLNYNVSAVDVVTGGTAATAVAGGVGTADLHTITLTGSMAAGQAGDCAGANAAACAGVKTANRTLTITY